MLYHTISYHIIGMAPGPPGLLAPLGRPSCVPPNSVAGNEGGTGEEKNSCTLQAARRESSGAPCGGEV